MDNKTISWDEIYNYFYEQEKDNFDKVIEVYADKEVHFEYIAAVMELAGDLNIDKVNFILKSKNIY
ncbi:MAG: ExbD/TolR family protein [Atribacterota bacterium]